MTSERKEGVIIMSVALLILLIITFVTDWDYRLLNSEFGPYWFYPSYPLRFKFATALIVFVPIVIYGFLRATGVVKRIFPIEAHISKIIPSDDE